MPVLAQQRANSLSMAALESPIPGMARPAYLDGSLAGDVGLDPLKFVEKYGDVTISVPALRTTEESPTSEYKNLKKVINQKFYGYQIALGPNTKDAQRSLMWMREAEVSRCLATLQPSLIVSQPHPDLLTRNASPIVHLADSGEARAACHARGSRLAAR